jgi:hypothetical protein
MLVFFANYLFTFINYKIFTTHAADCSIRIGKIPLDLLPQQFHNGCRLMNYLATLPPALARPWSSPTISVLSEQRTWPPPPRPLSTHSIWRCSTIDCKVVVRMNPHGEQDSEEHEFFGGAHGYGLSGYTGCHTPVLKSTKSKPPYVCPGCLNYTHDNNMINRWNIMNKQVLFLI